MIQTLLSARFRSALVPAHRQLMVLQQRQLQLRGFQQSSFQQRMPNIDQNHPAVRQIKSNPRVMETMKKAMELMHRKGYIDLSNPSPPSFMSMMKMLADSEIKKTIAEMQAVMKEEGIGFKPEDLAVFINSGAGGFSPPKDDGVRMKESGVDEKGAGLFERISKSIKGRS